MNIFNNSQPPEAVSRPSSSLALSLYGPSQKSNDEVERSVGASQSYYSGSFGKFAAVSSISSGSGSGNEADDESRRDGSSVVAVKKSKGGKAAAFPASWIRHYIELQSYYVKHGNIDVSKEENDRLAGWITKQKQDYWKWKVASQNEDEPHECDMTKERIQLLENIGMKWGENTRENTKQDAVHHVTYNNTKDLLLLTKTKCSSPDSFMSTSSSSDLRKQASDSMSSSASAMESLKSTRHFKKRKIELMKSEEEQEQKARRVVSDDYTIQQPGPVVAKAKNAVVHQEDPIAQMLRRQSEKTSMEVDLEDSDAIQAANSRPRINPVATQMFHLQNQMSAGNINKNISSSNKRSIPVAAADHAGLGTSSAINLGLSFLQRLSLNQTNALNNQHQVNLQAIKSQVGILQQQWRIQALQAQSREVDSLPSALSSSSASSLANRWGNTDPASALKMLLASQQRQHQQHVASLRMQLHIPNQQLQQQQQQQQQQQAQDLLAQIQTLQQTRNAGVAQPPPQQQPLPFARGDASMLSSSSGSIAKTTPNTNANTTSHKARSSTGKAEQWFRRYNELKAYKAVHGNANVPKRYQPNPALGTWVSNQRSLKRLLGEGKPSHMTWERVQLLESIGFEWSPVTGPNSKQEEQWMSKLKQLQEFQQEHHHCRVPTKNYKPNPALGQWVNDQRRQYRLMAQGLTSSMTVERVMILEAIEFEWSLGKSKAKTPSRAA